MPSSDWKAKRRPLIPGEVCVEYVPGDERSCRLVGPLLHQYMESLTAGLFVAAGPSFRRGLSIGRFECVEIYNLMAEVLGLEPAPNDGDPETILHILSSPDEENDSQRPGQPG